MWLDTVSFGIDWVNVTVDCSSIDLFLNEVSKACNLDLQYWRLLPTGLRWYPNAVTYELAGKMAIVCSYHLLDDGSVPVDTSVISNHGIAVSISGDGCRYLNTHFDDGLREFLKVCVKYPHKATRVDTYMDIFDSDNPIVPLFSRFAHTGHNPKKGDLVLNANMVRDSNYFSYMPVWDDVINDWTDNVYIGKRTSRCQCNIYNKRVEVSKRLPYIADAIFNSVGCTGYWYRIEYRAYKAYNKLIDSIFDNVINGNPVDCFFMVAEDFFSICDLTENDIRNISRCDGNVVWLDFMEWLRIQQNSHFVQLTTTDEYVSSEVQRLLIWLKRNSAFLASIDKVRNLLEDEYTSIVQVGNEKRQGIGKYNRFDKEIAIYE